MKSASTFNHRKWVYLVLFWYTLHAIAKITGINHGSLAQFSLFKSPIVEETTAKENATKVIV